MNKFTKQLCDPRVASLCGLWLLVSQAALAQGGSFPLSYAGRLTQADGAPVTGPVDVTVKFWTAYAPSTIESKYCRVYTASNPVNEAV